MQTSKLYDELSSTSSQQLSPQKTQDFDYAGLAPEIRLLVQNKTSELKSLMRRSTQDIINIGQKLLEVKEQLGHGNFRTWLLAEFEWSIRTAARFMQIATQFKDANLAHLNIAVSALYLLAEPSTHEQARQQVIELAQEGEKITYALAKEIVSSCQEPIQLNASQSSSIDVSVRATEENLRTQPELSRTMQTYERLEPQKEVLNQQTTELLIEKASTKEFDKDWLTKEHSEATTELQSIPSERLHILSIKPKKPELIGDSSQNFELTFAGICVVFQGYPEALLVLFEQMHNNPFFAREILEQSRLLANGTD
jgi:hypothetical protein